MTPDLRFKFLLVASLFFLRASSKIVGTWALDNFSTDCPIDGHSCTYDFQIIEGLDRNEERITECTFTIHSQGVPANVYNFTSQPCDGSDIYQVNAGWDPLGFITLCVSRSNEDTWAFFGYESEDVLNANASWLNVRPAYEMLTFNATDEPAWSAKRETHTVGGGRKTTTRTNSLSGRPKKHGGLSARNSGLHWTVEDLLYGM